MGIKPGSKPVSFMGLKLPTVTPKPLRLDNASPIYGKPMGVKPKDAPKIPQAPRKCRGPFCLQMVPNDTPYEFLIHPYFCSDDCYVWYLHLSPKEKDEK